MPSNVLVPAQWPTIVSYGQPSSFLPYVPGSFQLQNTLSYSPFYLLTCCPYYIIPDTHPYRPPIRRHPSWTHQPSVSPQSQSTPQDEGQRAIPVCIACPQCWNLPKLPDHRFCSIACSQLAARSAPQLTRLPPRHQISVEITTRFIKCWESASLPSVLAVYMINWSETSRRRFEEYRNYVEARGQFKLLQRFVGNEQKQFRGTRRACNLGEGGNIDPCLNPDCWMCETMRYGFGPHLQRKRSVPLNGPGIRLGAGIYTSSASSKADQYAQNIHDPNSSIHAMLVCRAVIGKSFVTSRENPTFRRPPEGHDCVFGKSGSGSHFIDDEYVFYDEDAIRPAYLVVYKRTDGH